MSIFMQTAYAAESAAPNPIFQFILPVIFFVCFYLFLIRPQNKRNKEHKQMIDSLQAGTEVLFAGGLIGRIESLDNDYAVISLNKNNEIKIQRASVVSVLPNGTIENL